MVQYVENNFHEDKSTLQTESKTKYFFITVVNVNFFFLLEEF